MYQNYVMTKLAVRPGQTSTPVKPVPFTSLSGESVTNRRRPTSFSLPEMTLPLLKCHLNEVLRSLFRVQILLLHILSLRLGQSRNTF